MVEASCSFNGTSNTATPGYVELVRQTSAGTFTNTTTLRSLDPDYQETIQTVGKDTATIEPTDSGAVIEEQEVHPQTGYLWQAPYGGHLVINGAGRLGLRVTLAASVSAAPKLTAEE